MAVYCCSDLHGQGWAWERIKAILTPEDILYFLGDAIDRGPDGINIAHELLNRPNTCYILGNHEDMMIRTLSNYNSNEWQRIWLYNGGRSTFDDFKRLSLTEREDLMVSFGLLPWRATYINNTGKTIVMNHSGYIDEYEERQSYEDDPHIWDRRHYRRNDNNIPDDTIVIHGHTPIIYIMEDLHDRADSYEGVYWYCNGKKCCVDCGVHFTDETVLLNLDTFEQIIIRKD